MKWDGEERREDSPVEKVLEKINQWLVNELGGEVNGRRIEGTINRDIRELTGQVEGVKKNVKTQNGRVGKLEKWQFLVLGFSVAASFFIGLAIPFIVQG